MMRSLRFISVGQGGRMCWPLRNSQFQQARKIAMQITAFPLIVAVAAVLLCSHFPGDQALASGCSAPSFAAERSFLPAAPRAFYFPSSVAVGDFDADGHFDLLVASEGTSEILAMLGNGDATFQPPVKSSPVPADQFL